MAAPLVIRRNQATDTAVVLCVRCRTNTLVISGYAYALMVEGRGWPNASNTCTECRTYPYEVRVRWYQLEQQSWNLPE